MDNAAEKINYILVNLINEVWVLEEKAIITEEFRDITNNDMHVIEAIGLGDAEHEFCAGGLEHRWLELLGRLSGWNVRVRRPCGFR